MLSILQNNNSKQLRSRQIYKNTKLFSRESSSSYQNSDFNIDSGYHKLNSLKTASIDLNSSHTHMRKSSFTDQKHEHRVLLTMDQNSASTDEYSTYYKVGNECNKHEMKNKHNSSISISLIPEVQKHSFDIDCFSSPELIAKLNDKRNQMNEDEKLADESLSNIFEREFVNSSESSQLSDVSANIRPVDQTEYRLRVDSKFNDDKDAEEQPARKSPSPESRPEHPANVKYFV